MGLIAILPSSNPKTKTSKEWHTERPLERKRGRAKHKREGEREG
jgi:hypothetical protein